MKFSISSTIEKLSNSSSSKKNSINRFSLFNKSKNSHAQNTEPSACINPLVSSDQSNNATSSQTEDVDNILKKYQTKPSSQPVQFKQQLSVNEAQLVDLSTTENLPKNVSENSLQNQNILLDPISLEQSKSFLDAKKKLRLVLSWPDCMSYNYAPNNLLK